MKPRVDRNALTHRWNVDYQDDICHFDTWQAAMDAALAWSREHYPTGRDMFGFYRIFAYDDNHDLYQVAVGQTHHEAIRNAARTLPTGNQTTDRRTP